MPGAGEKNNEQCRRHHENQVRERSGNEKCIGAKVGLRGAEAAFRNFETASLQSETSGCFVAMLAKVVQVR